MFSPMNHSQMYLPKLFESKVFPLENMYNLQVFSRISIERTSLPNEALLANIQDSIELDMLLINFMLY